MGEIRFLTADDAEELRKALRTEGYAVALREGPDGRCVLEVEPFDDQVVAMVDVYGGWLPDEV